MDLTETEVLDLMEAEKVGIKIKTTQIMDRVIQDFDTKVVAGFRGILVGWSETMKANVVVFVNSEGYPYMRYKTRPIKISDVLKLSFQEISDELNRGRKGSNDGKFEYFIPSWKGEVS